MNSHNPNIYVGRVTDIHDEYKGERIKVQVDAVGAKEDYAFPLLPKTFRVKPKVGEAVLVFTAEQGNLNSQKYYIGPIIPQYNNLKSANYVIASSLLDGGRGAQRTIDDITTSIGAFPNDDDVVIYGRGKSDIVVGDNDITLRCGVRTEDDLSEHGLPLDKPIAFNNTNPSYIKLKQDNKNSSVNIVANDINIISNEDYDKNGQYLEIKNTENNLISDETIESFKERLHAVPYGDVLVDYLKLLRNAILTHTHKYHDMPPTQAGFLEGVTDFALDDINSKHIKIS